MIAVLNEAAALAASFFRGVGTSQHLIGVAMNFCDGGCFPCHEPPKPRSLLARWWFGLRVWYWRVHFRLFGPRFKFKRIV